MISLVSPIETRAHHWPAGGKLAALCLASTALYVVNLVWLQLLAAGVTLVLYALPGRIFLRAGMRALRVMLPILAIVLVWHIVIQEPERGIKVTLQMMTMIALANLVTMTTSLEDMTEVLHRICRPLYRLGLPPYLLETLVPLVIRFTPVLIGRVEMLALAWRARSRKRPGWRLTFPLVIAALDDSEHVAEAMRARGGLLK